MPKLTILDDNTQTDVVVEAGTNLRRVLLDNGFSPYTALTRIANCGGRGICATCGVWVEEQEPTPTHWHDKLASRFGYPRLSCQITIQVDMTIKILDDKFIWGDRDGKRAKKWNEG